MSKSNIVPPKKDLIHFSVCEGMNIRRQRHHVIKLNEKCTPTSRNRLFTLFFQYPEGKATEWISDMGALGILTLWCHIVAIISGFKSSLNS